MSDIIFYGFILCIFLAVFTNVFEMIFLAFMAWIATREDAGRE
jgi:hypothetical protein